MTAGQREAASLPISTLQQSGPIEIFYSYSHKDERLRDELNTHLSLLRRQKLITGWYDRAIEGGKELDREIATHLNNAPIILLLVSPAFMASDYCYETGMISEQWSDTKQNKRESFPSSCGHASGIKLHSANSKLCLKMANLSVSWSNHDEAFLDAAKGIRAVVNSLKL